MGELLGFAALYDNRTVGDADILAWLRAIGDLSYADAERAVAAHYGETTDRLMPAHVRGRVKAMRADRIARQVIPAPAHELTDHPGRYKAALAEIIARMASGFSGWKAISAAPEPPREVLAQARAALPPALSKQDLARLQAEESRAGREAPEPGGDQ